MTARELETLVRQGEGPRLEFKRKVNHVEKILREVVAFANAEGGELLVGVSDDGELAGVKDSEEIVQTLKAGIERYIRPSLSTEYTSVPLSLKRSVVRVTIPAGPEKPYFLLQGRRFRDRTAFYRSHDRSIKASREFTTILKRRRKIKNGYLLEYGDHQDAAIKLLKHSKELKLSDFEMTSGLEKREAAEVLIGLVLANVLEITPQESGDIYTLKG